MTAGRRERPAPVNVHIQSRNLRSSDAVVPDWLLIGDDEGWRRTRAVFIACGTCF